MHAALACIDVRTQWCPGLPSMWHNHAMSHCCSTLCRAPGTLSMQSVMCAPSCWSIANSVSELHAAFDFVLSASRTGTRKIWVQPCCICCGGSASVTACAVVASQPSSLSTSILFSRASCSSCTACRRDSASLPLMPCSHWNSAGTRRCHCKRYGMWTRPSQYAVPLNLPPHCCDVLAGRGAARSWMIT